MRDRVKREGDRSSAVKSDTVLHEELAKKSPAHAELRLLARRTLSGMSGPSSRAELRRQRSRAPALAGFVVGAVGPGRRTQAAPVFTRFKNPARCLEPRKVDQRDESPGDDRARLLQRSGPVSVIVSVLRRRSSGHGWKAELLVSTNELPSVGFVAVRVVQMPAEVEEDWTERELTPHQAADGGTSIFAPIRSDRRAPWCRRLRPRGPPSHRLPAPRSCREAQPAVERAAVDGADWTTPSYVIARTEKLVKAGAPPT